MQNENAKFLEPDKMPPISMWQLKFPIDAVVFDCDSTLSQIEGINSLAEKNGVGKAVRELTQMAMSETGINPDIFFKRMDLVKPNRQQVIEVGNEYYQRRSPDVEAVISVFKKLGKEIFIVSAGLHPAVKIFGSLLGIPEKNIISVPVKFDVKGNYHDYDRQALPTQQHGKLRVIEKLKTRFPHIMYIGDGMNDCEAKNETQRFVGYGGSVYRENIAQLCQFYIKTSSFLPMLPLTLTQDEVARLTLPEKEQYEDGLVFIANGEVQIRME